MQQKNGLVERDTTKDWIGAQWIMSSFVFDLAHYGKVLKEEKTISI